MQRPVTSGARDTDNASDATHYRTQQRARREGDVVGGVRLDRRVALLV
jgi:hypothetical protein